MIFVNLLPEQIKLVKCAHPLAQSSCVYEDMWVWFQ